MDILFLLLVLGIMSSLFIISLFFTLLNSPNYQKIRIIGSILVTFFLSIRFINLHNNPIQVQTWEDLVNIIEPAIIGVVIILVLLAVTEAIKCSADRRKKYGR